MVIPEYMRVVGPYGQEWRNVWSVKFLGNPIELGPGCFSGCSSLKEIALPDSIQTICDEAFSGCTSLKKVRLGSGLQSIEDYAFENCTSLKYISIPAACTHISPLGLY